MSNNAVRVVSYASANIGRLRTVNITTVQATPKHKEMSQISAAQATRQHPTWMDSGGSIKGLPTIYIAGYAGPN